MSASLSLWRGETHNNDDYRTLRHKNLDYNPDFCEMKQLLVLYLAEQQLPKGKRTLMLDKSDVWKQQLFDNLHELLGEVVFTRDPELQLKVLDRVRAWYTAKVNIKARSVSPSLHKKTTSAPFESYDRSFSRLSTNVTPIKELEAPQKRVETPSIEAKAVQYVLPRIRPATEKGDRITSRPTERAFSPAQQKANSRFVKLRERQHKELKEATKAFGIS